MGAPPNHPFVDGIFPYKPSILGYPHLEPPHISLRDRHCHSAIWICADSGEAVRVACSHGCGSGTSVVNPTWLRRNVPNMIAQNWRHWPLQLSSYSHRLYYYTHQASLLRSLVFSCSWSIWPIWSHFCGVKLWHCWGIGAPRLLGQDLPELKTVLMPQGTQGTEGTEAPRAKTLRFQWAQ